MIITIIIIIKLLLGLNITTIVATIIGLTGYLTLIRPSLSGLKRIRIVSRNLRRKRRLASLLPLPDPLKNQK